MAAKPISVNIIGTGICGLAVALKLKEKWGERLDIVITSDREIEDTTSYVAGGLWEPYCAGETPEDLMKKWSAYTYNYYQSLYASPEASAAGILQIPVYNLSEELEQPYWRDIPILFQNLTQEQLKALSAPTNYKYGYIFLSYVSEPRYFLRWLQSRLVSLGGVKWEQKSIRSLQDQVNLRDEITHSSLYDIVVNCSGLGSRDLVDDPLAYPVRGQILHVKAPWITSSWTFGRYYVIPNRETLIVGGTAQKDDWNLNASAQDTEEIWSGVCEAFPSLQTASVEKVLVGLRPTRTTVRLEAETVSCSQTSQEILEGFPESTVLVVHCYGVGGCGYTIGMGLAEDVTSLVEPFVRRRENL